MKLKDIYDMMPPIIQNFICSGQGAIIKRQRYNNAFWDHLGKLNSTQWKDGSQINTKKENEIERLLNTCYKYVPYYTSVFKIAGVTPKDFKGLADIQKFTILEKEDIRNNWKQLVNINYPKKRLVHSHTSGSTGKALDFYQTKDSIPFQWAVWWRFRERYGFHLGDKHLNFTGKLIVPIQKKNHPYWRIFKPQNKPYLVFIILTINLFLII